MSEHDVNMIASATVTLFFSILLIIMVNGIIFGWAAAHVAGWLSRRRVRSRIEGEQR